MNLSDEIIHWLSLIEKVQHSLDLENVRLTLLGKDGALTQLLKKISTLPPEERKIQGAFLNEQKKLIQDKMLNKKRILEEKELNEKLIEERIDMTRPGRVPPMGKKHLITQTILDMTHFFEKKGFSVVDGPEIDTEFYNFDALNIPPHHPARQNHDTFYIKRNSPNQSKLLLRTHTTNVEIHTLKTHKPPLRTIAVGPVYRGDYDATHTPMFHQLEGFVIEPGVHMGHLKGLIMELCQWFFKDNDLKLRFRPSFFPFTEPSAEVDICYWTNEKGSQNRPSEKWMEVMGCGMLHPKVFENCGIPPSEKWQGFAFGLGIERFVMLKHRIQDIRLFYEGDSRFIHHYGV